MELEFGIKNYRIKINVMQNIPGNNFLVVSKIY
jgi:hypothetical protein